MNKNWQQAFKRLQQARREYEKANVEAWEAVGGTVERQLGIQEADWYLAERARMPSEITRRRDDAKKYRYDPIWEDDIGLRHAVPHWLRWYPTIQQDGKDWSEKYFKCEEEFSLFKIAVMRAFYFYEFMWIGTPEYPRLNDDEGTTPPDPWKIATFGSKATFVVWGLLGLYVLNRGFEGAHGLDFLVKFAWAAITVFFVGMGLMFKDS